MKVKQVRKEVKKLIDKYGSPEAVAVLLRISGRYVEMLRDGQKPGKRLYSDIVELAAGGE